jgi:hypothetical protein
MLLCNYELLKKNFNETADEIFNYFFLYIIIR